MLINKTIDNPRKKLALLMKFIKENGIISETKEHVTGLIIMNEIYINEPHLCRILNITKPTLKNWSIRKGNRLLVVKDLYNYITQRERINDVINDRVPNFKFSEVKYPRYYKIVDVYHFLNNESREGMGIL